MAPALRRAGRVSTEDIPAEVRVNVPPEIAFRHIEPTEALKRVVREGIDSIEKVYPGLISFRVMVEETGRGIPHVRLDIGIPGNDLIVDREASQNPAARDLIATVREAFDVARRQLREQHKKTVEGRRRDVVAPIVLSEEDEED